MHTSFYATAEIVLDCQKYQVVVILDVVPVRCSELAEPIAATSSKEHSAKLHWWRVERI